MALKKPFIFFNAKLPATTKALNPTIEPARLYFGMSSPNTPEKFKAFVLSNCHPLFSSYTHPYSDKRPLTKSLSPAFALV